MDYLEGDDPIIWKGCSNWSAEVVAANPKLQRICFDSIVTPTGRQLRVSRQHGFAVNDKVSGKTGMFRASQLLHMNGGKIRGTRSQKAASYHHIMLPRHGFIFAEGMVAEGFYFGMHAFRTLGFSQHYAMLRMCPGLDINDIEASHGNLSLPHMKTKSLPKHISDLKFAKFDHEIHKINQLRRAN